MCNNWNHEMKTQFPTWNRVFNSRFQLFAHLCVNTRWCATITALSNKVWLNIKFYASKKKKKKSNNFPGVPLMLPNPIKTSSFQLGLSGFDLWKSRRIGAYIHTYIHTHTRIYIYIRNIKNSIPWEATATQVSLCFTFDHGLLNWYHPCHISWDV